MPRKQNYTRYLVIKLNIEIDCSQTDQDPDDHVEEILDYVSSELDYNVIFSQKVEAGENSKDSIEVPTIITKSEVLGLLKDNPT